jgi:formylglycine-generating enzyme required for sulfatase activity
MTTVRHDDLGFRCAADPAGEIDARTVAAVASSAFALRQQVGQELEAADIDRADRLYLERRVLTWSMLEGRAWEALPRAVWIAVREPSDPLASDLIDGLERRLAAATSSADLNEFVPALERVRTDVVAAASARRELADLPSRVATALEEAAEARLARGDREGAAECLRLSLAYDPASAEVAALRQRLLPVAGRTRIWPRDGKLMAFVPEGTFRRGRAPGDTLASRNEDPLTTVAVESFWIDRTEVTNAEYRSCVEAGVCTPPERTQRYELPEARSEPVLWVSWFQAAIYARWVGKRLPSEAEWEYAARAGATTRYPWGSVWEDGRANLHGVRGRDVWRGPSPVASFAPNGWGLFDMIGNAWEWVADAYHDSYHGAPVSAEPWTQVTGADGEPDRVLRGGSYEEFAPRARVSARENRPPEATDRAIGFRCVADP